VDPYGSLDPGSDDSERPAPRLHEVPTFRVLVRGARKRCPRCGERKIFDGFFRLTPRCPTCDLRFEREEGGFLGAMALNYTVAIGFWFYPRSKTLWAAIEFLVARSEPGYRSPPLVRDPRTKDLE
jgi:uncharacterized protein (DUF983 family)